MSSGAKTTHHRTEKPSAANAVRARLISVASLIRRNGSAAEAKEAAEWEQLLSSNKFNPAKALN